jgi:hypothetical protein
VNNGDGTTEITDVRNVPCGSADATARVTKVTDSTSGCPPGQWLRSSGATVVVVCYVDA